MNILVALISSGKGTWNQVSQLIKANNWNHVYLVCNDFGYSNFNVDLNKVTKLRFDESNLEESFNKLAKFFKSNIDEFEIALNLYSGSGIEHMALLSAVLKSGLGVRFIYFDNGIKEFSILDNDYSLFD